METTKEALNLFLKSLPADSLFEVVSFGDSFSLLSQELDSASTKHKTHMTPKSRGGIAYTDKNVEQAIQKIR